MKKKVTTLEYKKLKPINNNNPRFIEVLIFILLIAAIIAIIISYINKLNSFV